MTVVAQYPLPYLPIKILDVAPDRSSVRLGTGRSSARTFRGGRRIGTAAVALLALAAIAAANVGAAPVAVDPSAGFRLAPGHATPVELMSPAGGSTDVRLAPGHAMPESLIR
jgi:hypothetical protein